MAPSVLIIGASGIVGRHLIPEFLKHKASFERIGILADPAKASRFAEVQSQGVEVVIGSFLEASSYQGFDTVISLAGNAIMKLQPGMVDAAIAGGARHFYPSELGADLSRLIVAKHRYFRDKAATREHLRQRAREVPGFAYTVLMTCAFTEVIISPMLSHVDVVKHTAAPYGTPDAPLAVTSIPDIVRYIVESVLLPLEPGQSCRELRVAGESLTFGAFIKILEEVQGVSYDVKYLDVKEAEKKQEEARVAGDTDAEIMWAGKTMFATGIAYNDGPFDNARFSFQPETARETFQRLFKR
ncbi:hypothetical protein C8R47DRAFT_976968 [Mycena vitilis]|nr:hypothetical protein C8R47DRAFT_976968 [Mycena vitilis]